MPAQNSPKHIPVMLEEVLEHLAPQAGHYYIDGTLGMGGHSRAILEATQGEAQIVGIDRDPKSLEIAKENLAGWPETVFIHGRFSQIPTLVDKNKPNKPLGGILLDLGISSYQLDNKEYGLTFSKEAFAGPLDMRLDEWCKLSAAAILNEWPQDKIADLFWDTADYRQARKLAKLVIENRPIETLGEFVKLCNIASGTSSGRLGAATLPLMALRIAVNQEYEEIESGLQNIIEWMEPGAKLAVISFHSGEDRIVKNIFKSSSKMMLITKKPLAPSYEEIKNNVRSRSAKLRVACKISSIENNNI